MLAATKPRIKLFGIIFFYFLFSSADLLEFSIGPTSIKFSRFFAVLLFLILIATNRFHVIGKNFFLCFLTIFSSFLLSCCFSYDPFRSLLASGAGVLTYVCFFLVPINLIYLFGREQVLRLYFLSFLFLGLHALSQCALSLLDIHDPFATQFVPVANVARGQSFTYEPSYYALFAVPFAFFFQYTLSTLCFHAAESVESNRGKHLVTHLHIDRRFFFLFYLFCHCFGLKLLSMH